MAPTPDVRVRLSAEGIDEIFRHFKAMEAQSDKTGRKMGQSFKTLEAAGSRLSGMFSQLASVVSVGILVNFVRNAGAAADAAGDLAASVGSSVTNLSALVAAGRQAGAGPELIEKGLKNLSLRINELRDGAPAVQKMFKDIGLSAKDFDGLDASEAFALVASKVGPLEGGVKKLAIASDIFGDKLGVKLIPLLNDSAVGMDRLVEHARKTGQLFTDEDTARVQAYQDALDSLGQTAQVASAKVVSGFGLAVTDAIGSAEDRLAVFSKGFTVAGYLIGIAVKFIGTVIVDLVDVIATGALVAGQHISGFASQVSKLLSGDLKGVGTVADEVNEKIAAMKKSLMERLDRSGLAFSSDKVRQDLLSILDPTATNTKKPSAAAATSGMTAGQKAKLSAEKTFADNLLQLQRARAKAEEDADKRLADFGIMGVDEYYERRKARIVAGTEAELGVLRAARRAAAGIEDPNQQAAELDRIAKQEEALHITRDNQIDNESEAQRQALADLERKALDVQNRIDDARGKSHEKALREIEELAQAEDRNALQAGRATRSDELRQVLTLQADFNRDMTDAQAALNDLSARREQIEARIQAGRTGQINGQAQILNLERSRLPVLEEIARKLQEEAARSQNPDAIRQADDFARAVERIHLASQAAHNSLGLILNTFQSAGQGALAEFFNSGIEKAHGFQDALRSVLADMRQLVSQMLSQQLFNMVLNVGKNATGANDKDYGVFASGGLAMGPGTTTSDSIRAWLSKWEFVTRAAVVRQPGALPFLYDFNRHGMDALRRHTNFSVKPISRAPGELRFRDGGLVSASPSFTSAGRPPRPGRLVIEVPEGMIARVLESPEGQRILVKNTAKNPRAMRNALGG